MLLGWVSRRPFYCLVVIKNELPFVGVGQGAIQLSLHHGQVRLRVPVDEPVCSGRVFLEKTGYNRFSATVARIAAPLDDVRGVVSRPKVGVAKGLEVF